MILFIGLVGIIVYTILNEASATRSKNKICKDISDHIQEIVNNNS